jgi:nicotinamide-nucleotide amidase
MRAGGGGAVRAEIVSIGSELLLGQIVDTNAAVIARHLAAIGVDLFHKVTVGDNRDRAAEALVTALGRAEIVVTTGGLGPTADDVTREAAALATGRDLEFLPALMADIEAFFRARGLATSPSNQSQAFIPRGAVPLPNPVGTAPCFIVEEGDRALISLPGVPREMEHLLVTRVLPYLRARYHLAGIIVSRLLRLVGLGESRVGEALSDLMTTGSNPTVGTMAHLGQVDVRIAAKAPGDASARALIAPVEAEIRARLGDVVFGVDGDTLEGVVGALLCERDLTLALVEAGTGGLIAERLSSLPAVAPRVQGLIAPADLAARRLEARGEAADDLARAAMAWAKADVGAAVVLGSVEGDGASPVHPGCIAVVTGPAAGSLDVRLGGDFRQVRTRAQVMTLDRLRRVLLGLSS